MSVGSIGWLETLLRATHVQEACNMALHVFDLGRDRPSMGATVLAEIDLADGTPQRDQ